MSGNKMALDALTAIVEADDAQCLGQSHIEQARAAIAALQAEEVERLAAQAASAPAVRMLTPEEEHALCIEHGATVSAHLLQAIQRKFCAVNAGKRIPADRKIGGV